MGSIPLPQTASQILPANMDQLREVPYQVSLALLRPLAPPRRSFFARREGGLLDLKCGSDPRLAEWALKLFDSYTGVDDRKAQSPDGKQAIAVTSRMKLEMYKIDNLWRERDRIFLHEGEVGKVLPELPKADVVHTRFLLQHFYSNQRPEIIQSLFHKGLTAAVFVERDWTPFAVVSGKYTNHIDDLIRYMNELLPKLGFYPKSGKNLLPNVRDALKGRNVEFRSFRQQESQDLGFLAAMCAEWKELAAKRRQGEIAERFGASETTLRMLMEKQVSITYTPPTVNAVTVRI